MKLKPPEPAAARRGVAPPHHTMSLGSSRADGNVGDPVNSLEASNSLWRRSGTCRLCVQSAWQGVPVSTITSQKVSRRELERAQRGSPPGRVVVTKGPGRGGAGPSTALHPTPHWGEALALALSYVATWNLKASEPYEMREEAPSG